MKRRLILATAVSLTMINSQADPVRGYDRKDGSHVSSYDRNAAVRPPTPSSTAAPAPGSIDYNAIYSAKTPQQGSVTNGQPPIVVTVTGSPSTTATSTITRNQWISDTLNVYGTLSNVNVTMKVVGFDKSKNLVTESDDYTIESDGTFHARLSDPKKEIRFLKVMATDKTSEVAQVELASTPIAAVETNASSVEEASPVNGLSVGVIIIGVILGLLWLVVKSISSKVASSKSGPTESDSANQKLALADLAQGSIPHRYHLEGFLPKKGEGVIWAFPGVEHYQKGTHSEWVGRSSGASVRVFKGFWLRSGANRGHKISHSEMDYQGAGTLVLTTIGLCFIGTSSTRIPLAHILAFQSYSDGIGFDTDYTRNNRHVFTQIHAGNVAFIATALDTIKAA